MKIVLCIILYPPQALVVFVVIFDITITEIWLVMTLFVLISVINALLSVPHLKVATVYVCMYVSMDVDLTYVRVDITCYF